MGRPGLTRKGSATARKEKLSERHLMAGSCLLWQAAPDQLPPLSFQESCRSTLSAQWRRASGQPLQSLYNAVFALLVELVKRIKYVGCHFWYEVTPSKRSIARLDPFLKWRSVLR